MALNKIQSVERRKLKICDSVVLSSGVTVPCITGQVGQVDVISQNGYRYKKGFWDKVLSDPIVQASIENRDMLGMIEHPVEDDDFLKTPYDKASHIVMKAWVQDGNPYATFGLLNNKDGNQIKSLIDVGHMPGVSTRGLGNYDRDSVSQFVTDSEYVLITWDIVKSPNFADLKMSPVTDSLIASPLFKELCDMHQLKDSAYQGYSHSGLRADIHNAVDELLAKYGIK